MYEYEKDESYLEESYQIPVNENFQEPVNKVSLIKKPKFSFEPDFQTKLNSQIGKLHGTESQENVIENFYTDYQCPPPSKLSKLKLWKTSLGTKAGTAIAKTIQVVPVATKIITQSIRESWPHIRSQIIQKSQGCARTIKATAPLLVRPTLMLAGAAIVLGLGYLGVTYFMDTIWPAMQEAMKPAPVVEKAPPGIGSIANSIHEQMSGMRSLLSALSTLAGMMMAITGLMKLKQHAENPDAVSLSQPLVNILMAAALLSLPSFLTMTTETMLGSTDTKIVQVEKISTNENIKSTGNKSLKKYY